MENRTDKAKLYSDCRATSRNRFCRSHPCRADRCKCNQCVSRSSMSFDIALWFSAWVFHNQRAWFFISNIDGCTIKLILSLQPDCRSIYLYRKPLDMRKSINGLVAIVEGKMSLDPFSSHLFVFYKNNCSIVKCVYWKGNGLALWMKRASSWPTYLPMDVVDLNAHYANWLFDGYDLTLLQGYTTLPHHTVL